MTHLARVTILSFQFIAVAVALAVTTCHDIAMTLSDSWIRNRTGGSMMTMAQNGLFVRLNVSIEIKILS